MNRPLISVVTPALADANNGNWQTASRWARLLADDYQVELASDWHSGQPADLMIALHARRSAESIARFAAETPSLPLIVVLTGTDLYRDIHHDRAAQTSLRLANRLVVLHERALGDVPAQYLHKTVVCFQSTSELPALAKSPRFLRAIAVGHLRDEKDPRTLFKAALLLQSRCEIRIDHIGAALDESLGREAEETALRASNYRWLGALPQEDARRRIQRAHVLVHPSRMEGGAHVVMEAVCSGTPVLASRISGNVGMLGSDYDGYFDPGDAGGLAALLQRCQDERAILQQLQGQCALRAPLFSAGRERTTLLTILSDLLEKKSR